jgi:hypothetical protein
VDSIFHILEGRESRVIDISRYSSKHWKETLGKILLQTEKIAILHDYREKIGGAEYYVEMLEDSLSEG